MMLCIEIIETLISQLGLLFGHCLVSILLQVNGLVFQHFFRNWRRLLFKHVILLNSMRKSSIFILFSFVTLLKIKLKSVIFTVKMV